MWSTDSDFYTEEESDAKMGGVHGAPVFKRKLVTRENGQAVWTDELTDYSSQEVKNLLEKYRQRPREKPQNQLVHLVEEGADSVLLDSGDAEMFMGLTSDIYVQSALYCVGENSVIVVAIVGERFSDRYSNDAAWPVVSKEWTTLRQACNLLKGEGMKISVMMRSPELHMAQPLSLGIGNILLEGCLKGWKAYLLPLLLPEQGNPIEQVIEK